MFMVVMEMIKYTCIPSFTGEICTHGQVSPPYIAWCASLRSEEVVIGKSA